MNALDLSLKPLTLPCSSSVFLAAYYLCIPGPLRASGSVSLLKIATLVEVFCKSAKRSPVFAEVILTVPPHTSGPASDAQAQGGGRREHAKKGGSHGAERCTQGQRRRCSPGDGLPPARGYRLSFLCGKRGTRKLRLFRFPPPFLSTRPSLCARPLLQLTACLRLRTTLGSRRIPIFCGLFSSKGG